jgi:hypothetical protein
VWNTVTDKSNWTAGIAGTKQTIKDLLGSPVDSAKKVGKFFTDAYEGKPGAFIKSIVGIDNLEKIADPNVPLDERIKSAIFVAVDTATLGAGLGVTKAAKALETIKAAEGVVDTAKATKAVDAAAGAAKEIKAAKATKAVDAVAGAAKEIKAAEAAKAETAAVDAAETARADKARKAEDAREADKTRKAKEADDAREADKARKAKEADDAREADKARKAKEADDAREADKVRNAKEADDAREADNARKAKEADDAREADNARKAKEADDAREADKARKAKEAEDAREAEKARKAKEAEEAEKVRKAEEAKRRAKEGALKEPIATKDMPQHIQDKLKIIMDKTASADQRRAAILELQRDTRSMRTLKLAEDEKVREGFNEALHELVYDPHNKELVKRIEDTVPGMKGKNIKVDSVRTPGTKAKLGDINTDNDYRLVYQDEKGNWIEIDKRKWEKQSTQIFAEKSGYSEEKLRQALSPSRQADLDRELANATAAEKDALKKKYWAEEHGQTPTDKFHPEASRDYSDQAIDKNTGQKIQQGGDKPSTSITEAEKGKGVLEDPQGLGQMYQEKILGNLRKGNEAEAIAQAQKATDTLRELQKGYMAQNFKTPQLPRNLEDAMHEVKRAYTDFRANPAELNQKLQKLGFGGIEDFSNKLSSQFESFKWARK